jgi:hypothetical protein
MKKVVGIFICMLLICLVLPVKGTFYENNITTTSDIDSVPIINLMNPPMINLQNIPFLIENNGDGTANNITWEMNIIEGTSILEGKLFNPKSATGTIPFLDPDGESTVNIKISGLGIATIELTCSYSIDNISGCNTEFEVKQEWKDIGLFYVNLFLPSYQPDKEWVTVDNYSYFNDTDNDIGVELYHEDLLQKHNVRVVEGSKTNSEEVLFSASCKFINGTGVLHECWITEDIVTGGDAHWEVELVDGE